MVTRTIAVNLEEKIKQTNEHHSKMLAAVRRFDSMEELAPEIHDQMAGLDYNNRKKKILVIYYGGTLGMEYHEEHGKKYLVPTNDAHRLLTPLRERGLEEKMEVVWIPVLDQAIDSTNGRWPHWVSIANAVRFFYDQFDGFVVAGGTDTMSYLLAATSMIFPNIGKPIIGAAAQQPLGEWGDDAIRNLAFSLQAATEDVSGSHLAFYDVLRDGRHVFKVRDKGYDAFTSPEHHKTGIHEQGRVVLFGDYQRRKEFVKEKNLEYHPEFFDGIQVVEINPFQNARSLLHMAADPDNHAILLRTYGAGNVRDVGMFLSDPTHIEVLRELHQRGYPLVLGSPMMDGEVNSPYESGIKAIEAGVISGGNTTGSMLPVKMSRALALAWDESKGLDYWRFRKEMYKNHVGEFNDGIKDEMLNEGPK